MGPQWRTYADWIISKCDLREKKWISISTVRVEKLLDGLEPAAIKKRLHKKINVSVSIAEYARLDMQKRHI
jgi:hypothetical protein